MHHDFYRAEDFATDESFQEYVFSYNEEAIKYWEDWLEKNPEQAHEFNLARQLVINLQFRSNDVSAKKSFDLQQLQSRLLKKEVGLPQENTASKAVIKSSRTWWGVAAGLLLLLGLGYGFWNAGESLFFRSNPTQQPITTLVQQTIPRGQKQTIYLPDGTSVKLNSESTIRYDKNFYQGTREVYLSGEAYFEVAHDTLRPFVVYANGIETKVLGTAFNLKAYPDENNVAVALVHGKVEVSKSNDFSEMLMPTQMLSFDSSSDVIEIKPFDSIEIVGWKDWVLFFKDADFNEIKYKLERWYNVKIEVRGSLKGKAFSGKFTNDSLEEVLNGIGFSLHFQHEISDGIVTIQSNL